LKKESNPLKFEGKIIVGFLLAIFFVIGISLITYFSIKNLLSTVENLTEPNEKLQQLNGLVADVYLLDMARGERTTQVDSVLEAALSRIDERLFWLIENSVSSQDVEIYEKIHHNVRELLIGYAGLEEVRLNLNQRNFTQEALQSIEKRIKRQQESSELESIGKLAYRDFLMLSKPNLDQFPVSPRKSTIGISFSDSLKNQRLLRNLGRLNLSNYPNGFRKEQTDSVLVVLRGIVQEIFVDEQSLKGKFTQLEAELLTKNKEIFSDIQQLVSGMQRELLLAYLEKNESAYDLSYKVSVILALMVVFVILTSFILLWNILYEIRRAHRYQAQLEEATLQSEKLAMAKQNFLANMSHEIRNPLHAIQGYQQALTQTPLDHEQKEYLGMIGFASETLISIVNDILDFSKLEAGKINIEKRPFDPYELFNSLEKFFALKAQEKQLSFHWELDLPPNDWIEGDALRITQILGNLISNSLKFTDSGSIEVRTKYLKSKKRLCLSVKDSGLGMSKETLDVVFQEFHQGDTSITRKFGGTGLGLSIVKRLVELQDGKIQVKSELGKGTLIEITFPVKLVPAQKLISKEINSIALADKRILLVDDDKIGLKFLKIMLERRGAEVIFYEGGKDFKENFKGGDFDLAILDIQMPEVSGQQVLQLLKQISKYSKLPILAMTANVFVEEQSQLFEMGFDGLILKPFNEEQILNKIAEILTSKAISNSYKGVDNNLSQVKMFDLEDIFQFCMNDEQLVHEIMVEWVNTTVIDQKRLKEAIAIADYQQIQSIAHQLSSRLAQIKAEPATKARWIENQLKKGNTKGLEKEVWSLIQELEELIGQIAMTFPPLTEKS
jgi:signal transduction histidine kinase/FixJ family two-component response regulator